MQIIVTSETFNLCWLQISVHKDPYENIYCVVSGHKDFILIPPVSYHNVTRRQFPSAVFKTNEDTGEMDIVPIIDGELNSSKRSFACHFGR